MSWLSGKKTYIIGSLMVALGVVHIVTGAGEEGWRYVLDGLAFMGLRAGVSKLGA
jgi:hypothetical protein